MPSRYSFVSNPSIGRGAQRRPFAASVADNVEAYRNPDYQGTPKSVVVIGAGMAGLTAANELASLGTMITVGGRVAEQLKE